MRLCQAPALPVAAADSKHASMTCAGSAVAADCSFALAIAAGAQKVENPKVINSEILWFYGAGRHAEAIPIGECALAFCEKALGADHPNVGTSLNNLADLYKSQSWKDHTR